MVLHLAEKPKKERILDQKINIGNQETIIARITSDIF